MKNTSDPLYETWKSIKSRTCNPNCKDYPHYGGHGIRICKEWKDDFPAFRDWALSRGWKPGLTIDRVNNNRGYSPTNCRIASRKQQAYNRTTNTRLEHDGEFHTIEQWSAITGIKVTTIIMRLQRGWTVDDALSIPVGGNEKK